MGATARHYPQWPDVGNMSEEYLPEHEGWHGGMSHALTCEIDRTELTPLGKIEVKSEVLGYGQVVWWVCPECGQYWYIWNTFGKYPVLAEWPQRFPTLDMSV